jgi:hypothetical protein
LNRRYQVGEKSANLILILLFGEKLSQSDTMPATPDQADSNRGKKECDYLRHSTESLSAHPPRELIGVAKRDRDQPHVHQKRDEGKDETDRIDQNK